ncbi:hypothetical protein F5B22DRAFT_201446 [Xylaria bambusicola]|uniref:uncharacterized protein n=1 Tax=Xylaria bambusicola TaxID=326684 RepID=UPI002007C26E|nr:uncharacterized protein F5B22DRAFT_201446 [Xylaria bambusicola]KAI0515090.1 hypothetical protein F5B22DRAFT_201446 [Xylaria bambusicola]
MTETRTKRSESASVTTSLRSNLRVPPLEGLLKFGSKLATSYKGAREHHVSQVGEASEAANSGDASGLAAEVATTCTPTQTETDSGYGTTSVDGDAAVPARATLTFSRKPIPQQYLDRLFDIRALFTESLLDTMSTKQRPTKGASMKLKYADHDDSIYLVIQCDKRDAKRMRKFFAQSHVKETIGDDINIHVTTGLRQLSTQELKVYKRAPGGVTSGTMVKISGANRSTTATVGGVISVVKNGQETLYGMTAGHILRRLIDESTKQWPCPRSDSGSDSDTSYDSDESSYLSGDDQSEVLPGPSWQPLLDLGVITEHSLQSPSSSTNHDWALITLYPRHSISNLNQMPPPYKSDEAHFMTMKFNTATSISTQSSVKVITPTSRGNQRGTLTPGTSGLLVAPGRQFVETHDVVLDDGCSFQPGDSGSWVIGEATGKVYGHVVSIDMFGEANVMPFDHTLRDIQAHLQADFVGLPEVAKQPAIETSRPKPQCWEHGCNGRQFSTFSNLLRHQREKSGQAVKASCPNCGAEFTRTTARNSHLLRDKCNRERPGRNVTGSQPWPSHGGVGLPVDQSIDKTFVMEGIRHSPEFRPYSEDFVDSSLMKDAERLTSDSGYGTDTRDAQMSSCSSWSPDVPTTIAMPLPRTHTFDQIQQQQPQEMATLMPYGQQGPLSDMIRGPYSPPQESITQRYALPLGEAGEVLQDGHHKKRRTIEHDAASRNIMRSAGAAMESDHRMRENTG